MTTIFNTNTNADDMLEAITAKAKASFEASVVMKQWQGHPPCFKRCTHSRWCCCLLMPFGFLGNQSLSALLKLPATLMNLRNPIYWQWMLVPFMLCYTQQGYYRKPTTRIRFWAFVWWSSRLIMYVLILCFFYAHLSWALMPASWWSQWDWWYAISTSNIKTQRYI